MKITDVLKEANFPPEVCDVFLSSGIEKLYPPQAEAIKKGILKDDNVLMSVPTAAGKTFVAELCMINSIVHNKGRCLYIAPLKALASEKYREFKKRYEPLGIEVGIAIGDIDSPSKYLEKYQIVVATAEKVDSLIRFKAKWLIESLSVVVIDEIHFINDGLRGPVMEILIARIKQLNENIQILALSATVKNAQEMADWLDANLVKSTWRPIPLREGVYFNKQIEFYDGPKKDISEEGKNDVCNLSLDTLRGKGQVLIFVNSRRSAQAVSREVCKTIDKVLTPEEKQKLLLLSKKVGGQRADATKICQKLADVIKCGAAFHHAGLKPHQRELIEDNFRSNLIKVIGCTPTLAAGVNLPARRAIIRDCKRFESGIGQAYIPTSEYKQCAGRAGRPQYDDYGEAVLIAKTNSESSTLFEKYIEAEPEPVISKLASESALRIHILSSLAGGYVHDVNGMLDFISHTFLYHQKLEPDLQNVLTDIFDFLHRENFIEKSGERFFATPLGNLTSRLYIDPLTSITIREGIKLLGDKPLQAVGMLHLIASTPDFPSTTNMPKKLLIDLEDFAAHHNDEFILTPENCVFLEDYYQYLGTLKASFLLNEWIDESKEDSICDLFNIGPGDIYRQTESAQWLLYAASLIAELFHKKSLTFGIENLRLRIRYGVKEELLDIVRLKGVGRVRARNLNKKGILKLSDLQSFSTQELADIPTIGLSLANDIKKQIFNKSKYSPKVQTAVETLTTDEWDD